MSDGSGTLKKIKLAKKTPKLKGRKKQKKEIKEISESDVEGLSESEIEDEASENEEAAQVNFNEDDELINMSVGQHDEFLSEEEKEHEVSKRKTPRVKSKIVKVSEPAREEPTPGCPTQDVDSVQSEEDMEISFNVSNRNKSNSESPKRLRLSDFADECEILQTSSDEEASMRRFTIFLEKNGYIKKVDKKDIEEEKSSQATSKMTPNRNREGQKEKGKRKVVEKLLNEFDDQGSELTIYRAAVEMDLSDKEIGSGNSSDNSKRLSSSSEEMNSSGEAAAMQLISEVRNQVTEENKSEKTIGDKEQILYQQFIDCRLREQRTQAQDRHGRSDSQPQLGTSYQQHHEMRHYDGH